MAQKKMQPKQQTVVPLNGKQSVDCVHQRLCYVNNNGTAVQATAVHHCSTVGGWESNQTDHWINHFCRTGVLVDWLNILIGGGYL